VSTHQITTVYVGLDTAQKHFFLEEIRLRRYWLKTYLLGL